MTGLNTENVLGQCGKMSNREGFTLLEVIVAISILTVGLLAVASMQASSIRGNAFAAGVTEGATWAADRMEKLMSIVYDNYDDAGLQDTDDDGDDGLNDTNFDNDPTTQADADYKDTQNGYDIFWNVSEDSLLEDTKTVRIIVTWTDQGVQKSLAMRHIIPKMK